MSTPDEVIDDPQPGLPEKGTSTAASGPAGSHFEGQVGAFYLLSMLSGAPPRGLPGMAIDRIALQQANAGRPLDDVVVFAHDPSGVSAVLEIQVKRDIAFTASDPVFRKVVGQIVRASQRADFRTTRYELAIATSRSSRKIDGAYQDVLTLARQIGDARSFFTQIELPGAANDDMRAFVRTFRSHLREEGAADDEGTAWLLLRRLQILPFDFTAQGSVSEELARERVARVLHGDEVGKAGALWSSLIELSTNFAKSGGDKTRDALIEALAPYGYRLAGDRRHATARKALAESARLSLADIGQRVGNVVLSRQERMAAAHEAMDRGRYVEIRGDAGVGKSGVLRLLAEQMASEGQVVVLSPNRCTPRGWTAMRGEIGFDGTLRELLVELANDGGATLFIDNLDFFSIEERLTVSDFVREASLVPGASVVATARLAFGIEEPSWLPADALDRLVRSPPIEIDALSAAEIEQLKVGNPALRPLLADSHPAHKVTRNLFRLARLASQPSSEPLPRTEIDMAEQWWKTADGARDTGWRDRARLLQDAAEQTLTGVDALDMRGRPAQAIDALIESGSFRNLRIDVVAFRHDVFREWAVGSALYADPSLVDRLQLERPAPAMLTRGVELTARARIERVADGAAWLSFLAGLSANGAHPSWRRAALLALVRSEAGAALLQRASPELQANGGALLRELIRTVLAVEVTPAKTAYPPALLAKLGLDPEVIPGSLSVPRGPAWFELISWLLSLGEAIPEAAIPEVVELYTTFSVGSFGLTGLTPLTTQQLYKWLRRMEPWSTTPRSAQEPAFLAGVDREQRQSLRTDLRNGFLLFCRTTPELAAEYLRAVTASEHNDELVRAILKMRGTLAQAAPAELAVLTAQALIAKPDPEEQHFARRASIRDETFTFLDSEFLSTSPAQGPFFELLTHAPAAGLKLVRQLVDHAITVGTQGQAPGQDVITLALPDGERNFPWTGTYYWSRQSLYCALTSGLMALEAWAHRRIDSGESIDAVLADVLGPDGSPAAYVLVAVDLLISHWPKSADAAIPFIASPELLCLDHTRQIHDSIGTVIFLGLGGLRTEPRGATSAAELKRRASRQMTLDGLIGSYISLPPQLSKLVELLETAATRLGTPSSEATLADPSLMAQHALNLAEPGNWQDRILPQRDGSTISVKQYVSPEPEALHLQALRDASAQRTSDFANQSSIGLALENPAHFTPEARASAMAWARRAATETPNDPGEDEDAETSQRMQKEAVLTAALIVARDGDGALREEHGAWARAQFASVLSKSETNPVYQHRGGLRFNPTAIAFAGSAFSLSTPTSWEEVRALLAVVARGEHAAAHGFGAALKALREVDARLPRTVLRCVLAACVKPVREWNTPEEELKAREVARQEVAEAAVNAEIAWLSESADEPGWPVFPEAPIQTRRHLRIPFPEDAESVEEEAEPVRPTLYASHQAAALWLKYALDPEDDDAPVWAVDFVRHYLPWTMQANGAGLAEGDEADRTPNEWNDVFFALTARCIAGQSFAEVAELAVVPITSLPDKHFFDALADFQRSIDVVFFGKGGIAPDVAVEIRSAFAKRMMTTRGWGRLSRSKDMSIEMHIGPAIATLFFNDHFWGQGTKCYLFQKGVERIDPFLPTLTDLVKAAPSPFVALVLLNLLEVAPRPSHLATLIAAGRAWLDAYPDFRPFWIDHGFGRRWCVVVDAIRAATPTSFALDQPMRLSVDPIIAALIALGIPEASRLDEVLAEAD